MRPRQPAGFFAFAAMIAVVRVAAYAGTRVGEDLSLAALVHYVALHALAFAFAVFLVAALSRATATRAAQVGLYAQAVLFLAPFVDVGLAWPLGNYEATYALVAGSPGGVLAALAYGAVLAWAVWNASAGSREGRTLLAGVVGSAGAVGLGLVAAPWPQSLLASVTPWSFHMYLAAYYATLAAAFLSLAVRFANPAAFRDVWARTRPIGGVGFALFPLVGILAAGRLLAPPVLGEPAQRFLIEGAYVAGASLVGFALWVQWRLVRATGWGRIRLEAAAIAKVVALGVALLLGPAAFLAAGAAGSVAWLARSPATKAVLGVVAAFAVLVGDLTVLALQFDSVSLGSAVFAVPIDQGAVPSVPGAVLALVVGVGLVVAERLTSHTSASGSGRASS